MNKLILDKKKITLIDEKNHVQIKNNKITVLKDTTFILSGESNEFDKVIFDINDNVTLNIKEINNCANKKINYEYHLNKNSTLNIDKFFDSNEVKEEHNIYLNKEYAKVNFLVRTISKNEEIYSIKVHHLANNTESNIKLKGVNILDGKINFNVEGIVPKNIKNCILNQDNRIYTFNKNKCTINPILLIENNDVSANHAAFIGMFEEEAVFYLMSRGISKEECYHLLIKGFLNIDNDEKIISIIHKYWR